MQLQNLINSVSDFTTWSHVQKIRFFAWYLHFYHNQERFNQSDIRACYNELYLEKPSNVSSYLAMVRDRKPKEVVQDRHGYYLVRQAREQLEKKYSQRPAAIQVDRLLLELPDKISDLAEQVFLKEALACFRCGAFRAAIVMSWNLAFDHLCNYVMKADLAAFNTQLPITYPKLRTLAITTRDSFSELKEFQIINICKSANIVSSNIHKILVEKLTRRNIAAHPSNIVISQLQAEDFITDLVNNVVIKLV